MNESCVMAIRSQEVYLNPSHSNKVLNANDLQNENIELTEIKKDLVNEIQVLVRERRILQQERNKLLNKAKELELELDATKVAKPKEVIELKLEVDSLKGNWLELQDEALEFLNI